MLRSIELIKLEAVDCLVVRLALTEKGAGFKSAISFGELD